MYFRLSRFLLPLVLTIIIQEFGGQFLNAGMARLPGATETLAAYGLAWGLLLLLIGPLAQTAPMSLVLAGNRRDFGKALGFVLGTALLLALLQTALALTPLGRWVIDDLHRIDPGLGDLVRTVLLWTVPVIPVRGLSLLMTGQLIRVKRTAVMSYATAASIAVGIGLVFALLPVEAIQTRPIWLPIAASLGMAATEWCVLALGFRRYVHLGEGAATGALRYREIVAFVWPLALTMLVQEFSRPLINLFIARQSDGALALAVLTVVYSLGQWPFRWQNEMKNLPAAFHTEDPELLYIRRFMVLCGLLSISISLTLFWTPVRDLLLVGLIGVDPAFAVQTYIPLQLFVAFSPVVAFRAWLHGQALWRRRTRVMAPSGPLRLTAILLTLVLLPLAGLHGATLGVAALLAGFSAETATVWWGMGGWGRVTKPQTQFVRRKVKRET
ncbi:MAG: hypothetical protein HY328_07180 [Chloroflexi bacterium]|nr:hypothetical protein [Chloroflexota bacterium]